ncbi:MAG: cation:proton antiporter [Bacteroidetes bacterium]|nr:cation:proton antiporter [Bacteroidota bacterium]MBS1944223.1 cation:proton antiporter [Bacteroidota bacterium]
MRAGLYATPNHSAVKDYLATLAHHFQLPLQNPVLVFSLILAIILLAPILLKRLNIPGIIGLIISGVVIGPHGLHLLDKNSAIDLFSTIGLLYIMFIAGLELDLNEFKAHRNRSLVFGLFTFAIPLAVGYPVCRYLLGYDFNAAFLTASMFATHTLVAYPIVSRLGVSKNQAVAITVGGTILTDTAVLIILAVIIGNSRGTLDMEFWVRLVISLAAFSAIMFAVIPRIAKWFFRKLENEKHSHYIFVLAVVFLAAFLAELAGVEAIIGAFVAGLALNKLIPHSSALMNRIEFIGNSLFIPFFLISVGMLVDVGVLTHGPQALIVAATLSAVALGGKWLAALFTQLAFKYSSAQRGLIFGLSGAHAAATLAVILVGYRDGILDDNILNGTILLILVTCMVASFATEKAAKRIMVESPDDGSDLLPANGHHPPEHILVPSPATAAMDKLLEFAIYIKDKRSANPISVLTVVSNNDEAEVNILKARRLLDEYVKQAAATETKVKVMTTIDPNVADGIVRISREVMADIIVLGWPSKSGFFERFLGDKLPVILQHVDKTVVIGHFGQPWVAQKRIVCAVPPFAEFEKGFDAWVAKVVQLAKELTIPLVVHCNADTGKAVMRTAERLKSTVPLSISPFEDWEDFLILSRSVRETDVFILISARKGAASYISELDRVPAKLERYFAANNRLVIFPQQFDEHHGLEDYSGISAEPLHIGIGAVQKLGKTIGKVFKKDEPAPAGKPRRP